jgi:hypothetical protein
MRDVPTTTLFVDFGEQFPGGQLSMSSKQLYDDIDYDNPGQGGIQGPNLNGLGTPEITDSTTLTFTQLSTVAANFDYNGVDGANAQDYLDLKGDVLSHVRRHFEPFDVNVVEVASANIAGIQGWLRANDLSTDGSHDSYVLVAQESIDVGLFGKASRHDITDTNARDDSALVFADNILAKFTSGEFPASLADDQYAKVVSHEAGHTFSLEHVEVDPENSNEALSTCS